MSVLNLGPRARALCTAIAIAAAAIAAPTSAQAPQRGVVGIRDYVQVIYRFCLTDIFVVELGIPEIPVGCEVIDCCPGCPGTGPLTWRIRLSGDPVKAMVLQFENLSPDAAKRLQIEGKGRWVGTGRLQIETGETLIRGFDLPRGTRAPVAIPRVATTRDQIHRAAAARPAGEAPRAEDVGQLKLVVEQMLGRVVVNEYVVVYRFRDCFWPPPRFSTDTIDLDNNAGGDDAVVLLDGRRSSGCSDDQIYRGADKILVGNVLTNGPCNSEVPVFSDDDAMQMVTPVTSWTDATGDVLRVDLTPDLWQAPVTVWLALAGTLATAQGHVAQANLLYNTNHAGVAFPANYQNVSGNPNSVATIGVPSCSAASNAALRGSGFYAANQLNVYYVNTATTGYNCIADPNIIVVGTGARVETLAHEIGHAFSLAHVNTGAGVSVDYNADGIADFPNTNVMWGGGVGRTTFSEAQEFRMNLNPTSMLNVNGVRTIPLTRPCADATISTRCPWLGLDAVPN